MNKKGTSKKRPVVARKVKPVVGRKPVRISMLPACWRFVAMCVDQAPNKMFFGKNSEGLPETKEEAFLYGKWMAHSILQQINTPNPKLNRLDAGGPPRASSSC